MTKVLKNFLYEFPFLYGVSSLVIIASNRKDVKKISVRTVLLSPTDLAAPNPQTANNKAETNIFQVLPFSLPLRRVMKEKPRGIAKHEMIKKRDRKEIRGKASATLIENNNIRFLTEYKGPKTDTKTM